MKADSVGLLFSTLEPFLKTKWGDLTPEIFDDKISKVLQDLRAVLTERVPSRFCPSRQPMAYRRHHTLGDAAWTVVPAHACFVFQCAGPRHQRGGDLGPARGRGDAA